MTVYEQFQIHGEAREAGVVFLKLFCTHTFFGYKFRLGSNEKTLNMEMLTKNG